MALSCQGEAIIPVDEEGPALRPAIPGMDTRTVEDNRRLDEQSGAHALFRLTGMPLHTIDTRPKRLRPQRHEPDTWRRAAQFPALRGFLRTVEDG